MAMNSKTRRRLAKKRFLAKQAETRDTLIANAEKRLPKDKARLYDATKKRGD